MLKKALRKILTGLSLPQEYICLDQQAYSQSFSVHLSFAGASETINVSNTHIFLGYKPLVIALFFKTDDPSWERAAKQEVLLLNFQRDEFHPETTWENFPASKTSVARLVVRKLNQLPLDGYTLMFYEGIFGKHHFLSAFHQFVGNVREQFIRRKDGNVSLKKNLYDQVRIAYAVPRNISVITIADGKGKMNMFPTDLHGVVGEQFYAGSLRINGKANRQVEQYRQVVISQVDAASYREVYALGKNHMMEFQDEDQFSLATERSKTFNFPLPPSVQQYRELRWIRSIDIGIHRIHLYEIVYATNRSAGSILSHIHLYCGQWRQNNHIATAMLFR